MLALPEQENHRAAPRTSGTASTVGSLVARPTSVGSPSSPAYERWALPSSHRLRSDGHGEFLGSLLAVVVGELHGEAVGAGLGRCPHELVVSGARGAKGLQGEAGRQEPAGNGRGVRPGAAAEEEVLRKRLADRPREG